MPTGRVKFYDVDKGFGFVASDEGGDVYVPKSALPSGVDALGAGEKIEFGVVDGERSAAQIAEADAQWCEADVGDCLSSGDARTGVIDQQPTRTADSTIRHDEAVRR